MFAIKTELAFTTMISVWHGQFQCESSEKCEAEFALCNRCETIGHFSRVKEKRKKVKVELRYFLSMVCQKIERLYNKSFSKKTVLTQKTRRWPCREDYEFQNGQVEYFSSDLFAFSADEVINIRNKMKDCSNE